LPVKKGDEVIYGRYAGNDIEVDGKEIKIMRESDILAEDAIEEPSLKQNALKRSRKTPRAWLYSEQFLAAVPTALLVGMYAAAAFSFWSVGPFWVGFLVGAVPMVGLALWAFAGPSSEVSG
jgi:hypothetical protein